MLPGGVALLLERRQAAKRRPTAYMRSPVPRKSFVVCACQVTGCAIVLAAAHRHGTYVNSGGQCECQGETGGKGGAAWHWYGTVPMHKEKCSAMPLCVAGHAAGCAEHLLRSNVAPIAATHVQKSGAHAHAACLPSRHAFRRVQRLPARHARSCLPSAWQVRRHVAEGRKREG